MNDEILLKMFLIIYPHQKRHWVMSILEVSFRIFSILLFFNDHLIKTLRLMVVVAKLKGACANCLVCGDCGTSDGGWRAS